MLADRRGPIADSVANGLKEFSVATRQAVQAMLAASGHYSGKVDGLFGPGTIRAFQDHWTAPNPG
jgi:peptidoglycan hydrolase-like protein with peptidoglycan-binding domain